MAFSPFGSPPLARGTPQRFRSACPASRFTPARAGNTRKLAISLPLLPVHPRSRGEHHCPKCGGICGCGSPPLARGTRNVLKPDVVILRFTPARAGNTPANERRLRACAVHPRSRGEHGRFGGLTLI